MATRLPPDVVKKVEALVETLFEDMKGRYLGPHLMDKRIVTKYVRELSLLGIYEEALAAEGGMPEKETVESILRTASNYIDSQKANAKARVVRAILAFLTKNKVEANERPDLVLNKLNAELVETFGRVTAGVERIVSTEAIQARNVGALDGIMRANAALGVDDPVVFWVIVRDGKACEECYRLHMMPDRITPRVWYASEISSEYHKRGEPTPSWSNLHPNCRCQCTTILRGYGFGEDGRVKYVGKNYSVIDDQRGTGDQPSVEKSEWFPELESLSKMSTPAGIETLNALRHLYEDLTEKYVPNPSAGGVYPHENFVNLLRSAPISINMPSEALFEIINSGRLMNLGETGYGQGETNTGMRQGEEERVLGIPMGTEWTKRPLYGALHVTHGLKAGRTGGAPRYGRSYLILKPHVRDRSTFTPDDSFSMAGPHEVYVPGQEHDLATYWINNGTDTVRTLHRTTAEGKSFDDVATYAPPYIEAQIHGGVDPFKDVESVNIADQHARVIGFHELTHAVDFGKHFGVPVHYHRQDGTKETLYDPAPRDTTGQLSFPFKKSAPFPYTHHVCSHCGHTEEPLSKSTPEGIKTLEALRHLYEDLVAKEEWKRDKLKRGEDIHKPSDKLVELFETAPITMNFPFRALPHLAREGRFKNLFETGRGMGENDQGVRAKMEFKALGIPFETEERHRPVYGALNLEHKSMPLGGANTYGNGFVVLKPHVKDRTTFTHSDSFDISGTHQVYTGKQLPLLAESLRNHSWKDHLYQEVERALEKGERFSVPGYLEAQIHGGVSFANDVASLHLAEPTGMYVTQAIELGKTHGFPVFVSTQKDPHFTKYYDPNNWVTSKVYDPDEPEPSTPEPPAEPELSKAEDPARGANKPGQERGKILDSLTGQPTTPTMMPMDKKRLSPKTISSKIKSLGLRGFGGECLDAAHTINREVFGGKGKIVGAANSFWLSRGRFLGHVAVEYDGRHWDTDAMPKEYDEIESWGMLDPEDPDYYADGWDDDAANDVTLLDGHEAVHRAWGR